MEYNLNTDEWITKRISYARIEYDRQLGRSRKRWLDFQIDLRMLRVVDFKAKARNTDKIKLNRNTDE
jgi:hypothetical protein